MSDALERLLHIRLLLERQAEAALQRARRRAADCAERRDELERALHSAGPMVVNDDPCERILQRLELTWIESRLENATADASEAARALDEALHEHGGVRQAREVLERLVLEARGQRRQAAERLAQKRLDEDHLLLRSRR